VLALHVVTLRVSIHTNANTSVLGETRSRLIKNEQKDGVRTRSSTCAEMNKVVDLACQRKLTCAEREAEERRRRHKRSKHDVTKASDWHVQKNVIVILLFTQ